MQRYAPVPRPDAGVGSATNTADARASASAAAAAADADAAGRHQPGPHRVWLDDAPVTNAAVRVGGVAWTVDVDGSIDAVTDLRGRDIDIEARGFLPRKTRIKSDTVTLWPAAGAREAEAIKQLAFYQPDGGGTPSLVTLDIRAVVSIDPALGPEGRLRHSARRPSGSTLSWVSHVSSSPTAPRTPRQRQTSDRG